MRVVTDISKPLCRERQISCPKGSKVRCLSNMKDFPTSATGVGV